MLRAMTDWAIDYILHVLETKDWSANKLAEEAGVASSTISRPLRERDVGHNLSRKTITKVYQASGIDPAPFIPKGHDGLEEPSGIYTAMPTRTIQSGSMAAPAVVEPALNEIRITLDGPVVRIVATLDIEGLAKLRRKIDSLQEVLQDE